MSYYYKKDFKSYKRIFPLKVSPNVCYGFGFAELIARNLDNIMLDSNFKNALDVGCGQSISST